MPKSKREKEVVLTKVKKKTRDSKRNLVTEVRACAEHYPHVLVLTWTNATSSTLSLIRQELKSDSRLFVGKNRVMAIALGRLAATEIAPGLHRLSSSLTGQCALLFTNRPIDSILKFLTTLTGECYARVGELATRTVTLPEGALTQFAFSQEPQLRKLGLPTKLNNGVVTLIREYTVCEAGEELTADQVRLLKLLAIAMGKSEIVVAAQWTRKQNSSSVPRAGAQEGME